MKKEFVVTTFLIIVVIASLIVVSKPDRSILKIRTYGRIDMCEKETVTWTCLRGREYPNGQFRYRFIGDKLYWSIYARKLNGGKMYQITLNGPGNTATDDFLYQKAISDLDPFSGGCWDGTSNRRDVTKCTDIGGEGFYNIEMNALTDARGNIRIAKGTTNMPEGLYKGVKILVKENFSPWQVRLFEEEPIDFVVIHP